MKQVKDFKTEKQMMKREERDNNYIQHFEEMAKISVNDGIYKLSESELTEMYNRLLLCLPNNGKLYKYRNFKDENNGFENMYSALSQGYIWLASPSSMNDKVDTTLNIDLRAEARKINKTLLQNKEKLLKAWIDIVFEKCGVKNSLSENDLIMIFNCYTKQGRAIKTQIRQILRKNNIPYSKLDALLKQIAYFIEDKSVDFENVARDTADKFVKINEEMRNKQRIFCLAESPYIESMWAYYGDNNRGFCVEYDFNKVKNLDSNTKRVLLNLFKIKYRRKRPIFSFIDMLDELIINKKQNTENVIKINRQIFEQVLIKNLDWSHEKEWRIIVTADINKFFADLVSAIYIDNEMIDGEKGQRLVALAKEKQWTLYRRDLNATSCGVRYTKFDI